MQNGGNRQPTKIYIKGTFIIIFASIGLNELMIHIIPLITVIIQESISSIIVTLSWMQIMIQCIMAATDSQQKLVSKALSLALPDFAQGAW